MVEISVVFKLIFWNKWNEYEINIEPVLIGIKQAVP